MNLNDKSHLRNLALIFLGFFAVIVLAISKCGNDEPKQSLIPKIDTPEYIGENPGKLEKRHKELRDSFKEFIPMTIQPVRLIKTFNKTEIIIASEEFVNPSLKFPESAEYDFGKNSLVDKLNDTTYQVTGNVVAPNAFNVKSRFIYSCRLIYHPDRDNFTCIDYGFIKWD